MEGKDQLSKRRFLYFRCFSDIEVNFNSNLTVIAGINGSGKSTVLEAAAIAAGTLSFAMDGLTNYGIKKNDVRNQYFSAGSGVDVQPQYPVQIHAAGNIDGKEISWTRTLRSPKGRCGLSEAKELASIADEYLKRMRGGDTKLILPVISYYSTRRLWNQYREKKNDTFEKSTRSNGYIDSLDGAANDRLMIKWFQKMTIQQYQRNEDIPEYLAVRGAVEQCLQSITQCPNAHIQFNLDTTEIDVIYTDMDRESVRLPVSQISDGYKCTISLIADTAYRMAALNPQLLDGVLKRGYEIVLIDEIDLHLHPSRHQLILDNLVNIFPKVQFIVSTHSPSVIQSIQNENLILLADSKVLTVSNETYGKDTNTILREVMNVSQRPQPVADLFARFYQCIDEEDYNTAKTVLSTINHIVGDNDPELHLSHYLK